jgi:hypothetical protein
MQAEWLKTRRSAASWLCLAGGFFLPVLFLLGCLTRHQYLDAMGPQAWIGYATRMWQYMGILLLPSGIVLAASLIMQVEYRSNSWKQLHTMPLDHSTIFFSKLFIIVLMTLKFFVFFNVGMLLSGIIPNLLFAGRLPADPFPVADLLRLNAAFLVACLPIIAVQFLLSLLFRNFLVSVGVGLLLVIGALLLMEGWKYVWLFPYAYSPLLVMKSQTLPAGVNAQVLAAAYSVIFTAVAYVLYRLSPSRG